MERYNNNNNNNNKGKWTKAIKSSNKSLYTLDNY